MENLLEARESIYDVVEMFFSGATIIWTEQINTKPQLPYITLKMGAIRKSVFTTVDENGKRVYQCSTILEINLYTKGKPQVVGEKTTGNYINTATSDMAEFVAFLESENITDILAGKGLGIMLQESIRDLTDLHNDSHFRYGRVFRIVCTGCGWILWNLRNERGSKQQRRRYTGNGCRRYGIYRGC